MGVGGKGRVGVGVLRETTGLDSSSLSLKGVRRQKAGRECVKAKVTTPKRVIISSDKEAVTSSDKEAVIAPSGSHHLKACNRQLGQRGSH